MAEPVVDLTVVLGEKLKAMGTSAHAITRGAIQNGLRAAAAVVLSKARRIIYGGHPEHLEGDTGRLHQSLQFEVHEGYATVGSNVVYAAIHEYGGTIVPKSARALAFQVDGQWVFAQSVTIPPRPYLHPAMEESHTEVVRVFGNTLAKELGP